MYVDQLATMKERELETLYVDHNHLMEFNAVGIVAEHGVVLGNTIYIYNNIIYIIPYI